MYGQKKSEEGKPIQWVHIGWRIVRPILVGLCSLCLVAAVLAFGWMKFSDSFITAVDSSDATPIAFVIESGSSLSKVSRNLEAAGLIKSHTFFKYYCDFAGMGQKIQAGEYVISKNMDVYSIANLLTKGDGKSNVLEITVIPGNTVDDIAAYLQEKGVLDEKETQEFLDICRTGQGVEDYYFIADEMKITGIGARKYLLEGYLAPDTYEIYVTATPLSIVRKFLSQTDKIFTSRFQERMDEKGISLDQTLTLASMVEKEAKKTDFARVSAVFHNRLNNGMKLESDPTIHYVTSIRRMSLTEADLAVNSPYNTYLVNGLPAGPICNPSPEAVQAALYPDESFISEGYLYFCSKDPSTGELVFNKTLQEHEAAVSQYAPLWKKYDEERGLN